MPNGPTLSALAMGGRSAIDRDLGAGKVAVQTHNPNVARRIGRVCRYHRLTVGSVGWKHAVLAWAPSPVLSTTYASM